MSDISSFESRPGKLSCRSDKAFDFISDPRNFGRFAREDKISGWKADKDSCSFSVSMLGTVSVRLKEKYPGKLIVYEGDALNKNDFTLEVHITENNPEEPQAKLVLNAQLNPVMKMMAEKPVRQFLEMLIEEIEKFSGWDDIIT